MIFNSKKAELKLIAPDSDIVRCFDAAVHNAAKINTVKCRYKKYNKTGLLKYPYMIRAGRNYKTPWTRDASINTWQGMNFIDPQVSYTTLFAVCDLDKKGEVVIQPDVQTWDQIVWAIGAYNYYLSTGDEDFLKIAFGVIERALTTHRKRRFNEKFGLFLGGSFFNDGIAGYPLSCHEEGNNNSFAPAHPVVETIMCLSTNCLYCEAYRVYAELSLRFGMNDKAEKAKVYHNELKAAINKYLWNKKENRYNYFLYPDGSADESQELSGNAFAVLFGICDEEKQSALLKNLVISENGTVSVWPPFEGLFSDSKPGRHNNVIWPFLNGMLIEAAAKCGDISLVGEELKKITALYKGSRFRLQEIYSPYTRKPYGGWQTGREWDSCKDQTWSATCYIGAFVHGIFGIKAEEKGVRFAPCVPQYLRDAELRNIKLRGQNFSVKVNGYGTEIQKFLLDGKESEPFVPWDKKNHYIEIVLK